MEKPPFLITIREGTGILSTKLRDQAIINYLELNN